MGGNLDNGTMEKRTVSQSDLVSMVQGGLPSMSRKDVDKVVRAVLACVTSSLVSGRDVALNGFGAFRLRGVEARERANNLTGGAPVFTPAHTKVVFRPGAALRDLVFDAPVPAKSDG